MIYNKEVQEAIAAGYSLKDIKDLAISEYNEAVQAGYDRKDCRAMLKEVYGLTSGKTQDHIDDAQYIAALMFENPEASTQDSQNKANVTTSTRPVSSIGEAFAAGFQNSTAGLVLRGEKPNISLTEDNSIWEKAAAGVAQGLGDLPTMIIGGAFGGAAGAAMSGLAAPVGAVAGAGAGAGFTTEYVRNALLRAYTEGSAIDFKEFTNNMVDDFLAGGKGALVGIVAGGAGKVAAPVAQSIAGKFANPLVSSAISGGTTLAAEASALTATMAALDQKVPTAEDFLVAGLTLGSFKLGSMYTGKGVQKAGEAAAKAYKGKLINKAPDLYINKFMDEFSETGRSPELIGKASLIDPTIKEKMLAVNQKVTQAEDLKYYRAQALLDETRVADIKAGKETTTTDYGMYAGKWLYGDKYEATKAVRASQPDGKTLKEPSKYYEEVWLPKNAQYIKLEGNTDSTMAKVVREYMKSDEGRAELESRDPEFFKENPDWWEGKKSIADERIVPTARAIFENPSDAFIEFLRTFPWSQDMVNKLASNPRALQNRVEGTPVHWSGIIQRRGINKGGTRYYMFNPKKIKPSAKAVTGETPYDKALNEFYSKVSINEAPSRTWNERINNMAYHMVDSFAALNKGAERGKRGQAYVEAIVSNGSAGAAEHMIDYGMINYKGDVIGKSLKGIIGDMLNNGGELKEFSAYLTARRFKELNDKGQFTAIDPDMTVSVLKGPKSAVYEQAAREVKEYSDNLLQYQLDAGLISKSRFDKLHAEYRDSIPLDKMVEAFEPELQAEAIRVSEGIGGKKAKGTLKEQIADLFGMKQNEEGKLYLDPIESLIRSSFLTTRLAMQNKARKTAAETYGVRIDSDQSNQPNMTTLTYIDKGKARRMAVPKEIREATITMDSGTFQMYNAAMQAMAKTTGYFRVGTTMTAPFAVKNFFIDQLTAWVQAPGNVNYCPFVSAFKGLGEIFKTEALGKDTLYNEWLKDGGSQASMVSLGRNFTQEIIKDLQVPPVQNMVKEPIKYYKDIMHVLSPTGLIKNAYKGLEAFTEYSDQMTRVGMYMEARKAGYSGTESAYISRMSTIDFARAGATTKALNSIIAFLNARMQGLARTYETIKDDPVAFTSKIMRGVVIPSALLALVKNDIIQSNQDPADPLYTMAETLRQAPEWMTTAYWLVPIPAIDTVLRIPKPYELAVATASPIESFIDYMYKHGTPDGMSYLEQLQENGFVNGIYDTMLPNVIPTPLVAPTEVMTNYSFFTGNNIIPTYLENQVPALQYKPGTSTTAKWISEMLFKIDPSIGSSAATRFISPLGIDHLVRGWTGTLGQSIVSVLDTMLEASGLYDKAPAPAKTIEELPFFRTFMAKYPSVGSKDIMKFNAEANEMQQRYNSIMAGFKSMDPHAQAIAQTLLSSTAFQNLQSYRSVLSQMSVAAQQINLANDDPESKRLQLENIYIMMTQVATEGRKLIKQIEQEQANASRQ